METLAGRKLNQPIVKQIFLFLLVLTTLTSCGVETYNSKEAFDYWENGNIGKDVEILNGQFWKSEHWTYEYAVFLKLKPSKKWKNKFFKIYQTKENHRGKYNPENTTHLTRGPNWFRNPDWFKPNAEFDVYSGYGGNYYWNEKENILLFYEMQL